MSDIRIEHEPDHDRFVALDGDTRVGLVEYQPARDLRVVTHTEVDDAMEGRGVGSALARAVLDDAREQGVAVLPLCPFVRDWIARHADYQDLVYGAPSSTARD